MHNSQFTIEETLSIFKDEGARLTRLVCYINISTKTGRSARGFELGVRNWELEVRS